MVASTDSYGSWSFGLTLGNRIRTSLTPLTLRTPKWEGMRLDAEAPEQGFTVLVSRGAAQRFSAFDDRVSQSPVLGYGGHYYRRPSEVLSLGLTLYNQHQVDIPSRGGSFVQGTQPYAMQAPRWISVWVESDAPEAGTQAAVYDMQIEVDILKGRW